ncbi:hypothetical protein ACHAXH_007305 [Discostella pseudostelligera]
MKPPFLFPTLVASILLLMGVQYSYSPLSMIVVDASKQPDAPSPTTITSSEKTAESSTTCNDDGAGAGSCQINEQKRGTIGRVLNWGLAKIENIMNDGILISDLISAFITKCDHMFAIMIHSVRDMFVSYDTLRRKEIERLAQFDVEFKDLVKLRHKIERKCLYSNNLNPEDRTLCVERGVEIRDKIQKLRSQRSKSAENIKRYENMHEWCAGFNNWFC